MVYLCLSVSSLPGPSASPSNSIQKDQPSEPNSDATIDYNPEDYAPSPAAKGAFHNKICGIKKGKKNNSIIAKFVM